jgi:hypothetical protein
LWDVFRCNDIGQDVLKAARQRWGRGRLRGAPGHPTRTRARPAPLPPPPLSGPGGGDGCCPSPPAPRPPRARPAPAPRPPRARPAPAPRPPRSRPAPPPAWAESESPAEAVAARRVKFQRVGSNSGSAAGEIRSPRRLKQLLQVTLQLSV